MGRPSKLTQRQADEVIRRLVGGERPVDLAREFGVSKATMSERYSAQALAVRIVAHQLMQADSALRALTPLGQLAARRLAAQRLVKVTPSTADFSGDFYEVSQRISSRSETLQAAPMLGSWSF